MSISLVHYCFVHATFYIFTMDGECTTPTKIIFILNINFTKWRRYTLKNKVCIFNTPSVAKFTHLKACFLHSLRCVFCGKGVNFYTPLGVYLQDKGV